MAIVGILGQAGGGGGISFPSTPSAGDTKLFAAINRWPITTTSYANKGYGITINETGVYRFSYSAAASDSGGTSYARLINNGVEVTGSEISSTSATPVIKTIDVSCSAGDVINLQGKRVGTYVVSVNGFMVSILAEDAQDAINDILTATAI
jgi:hypothetical protein